MKPIARNLLTLYADLAQAIMANPVRPAVISRRLEGGKRRFYASFKDGAMRQQTYVGTLGDPEAEAKVAAFRRAAIDARNCRKTVSIIKRSGISAPDIETGRLLDVLANAGVFDRGASLIGTVAYQLYPCVVGARLMDGTLMTQDAAIAVSRLAVPHFANSEDMGMILKRADPTFAPRMNFDDRLPKAFVTASGLVFEFITTQGRSDGPLTIKGLGVAAVPLRFMEYLLEDPIEAVALYGPGVRVRVPDPARYAVHKLIVSQLRQPHSPKREKDVWQARELFAAIGAREPDRIEDAIADARGRGVKWRKFVDSGLDILARQPQ